MKTRQPGRPAVYDFASIKPGQHQDFAGTYRQVHNARSWYCRSNPDQSGLLIVRNLYDQHGKIPGRVRVYRKTRK